MRSNLLLDGAVPVALLLLAMGCTAPKPVDASQTATLEDPAITKIWDTYREGVIGGNHELWLTNWDENGIKMNPDAPIMVGKDAIKARTAPVFANTIRSMTIKVEETQFAGDFAYCRGSFTSATTPKAGGATVPYDGKFLTILKKQPDGSWKIYRDIFNSNVPPK